MYNQDSSSDFRTFRTEQHVSLEKHRQTIENTLHFQQAPRNTCNQPNAVIMHVYRLFSYLLSLIGIKIFPKRKRSLKKHRPCMIIECSDCC